MVSKAEWHLPRSLEELPVSNPRYIGKPVRKVEAPPLLTGKAQFVDDLDLPGMLHCAILRSPYGHARIKRIDVSAALELPGVVAVVTGQDMQQWVRPLGGIPSGWGTHCLAVDKARFVGEPIAAVAAVDRHTAEDALDLIEVEFEPLPAVVNALEAKEEGAPLLYEDKGTNVMFHRLFTWGDVDRAFQEADHVLTEQFRWHRLGANPIETFGVIAQWDPVENAVTCWGSFQAPSFSAMGIAGALGLPLSKVKLVPMAHGGSFGGKGNPRGALIAAVLSRKAGGRPVKWIEDRLEYLMAGGGQAWERFYEASIAVKNDGTILGIRIKLVDDIGASGENSGAISAIKPLAAFTGCYAIPAAQYEVTMVATNKNPQSAYRGMGPPAHYVVLEQMVDMAARHLGLDPAEIRRRNFIPPDRFPYTIPSGNEYDSGNYPALLDRLMEMSGYRELRRQQEQLRREGRLVGLGLVSAVEPGAFNMNVYTILGVPAGTAVPEGATVALDPFGSVRVTVGFALEGQGQYTFVTQLMADYFCVSPEQVKVTCTDTLSAPVHFGPGGSRLAVALTGAVLGAAETLRRKLETAASYLLGCQPGEVELMDGMLRVKGQPERKMSWQEVVGAMSARPDLFPPGTDLSTQATYVWVPPDRNMPDEQGRAKSYLTAAAACHLALVEVDPETGKVDVLKYWVVDDCGTRLNPATVAGMTQGGVAQGIGAALMEEYVYDADGQLLTTTFMDYLLPTIYEVPPVESAEMVTPSPFTPLGVKGMGEGPMISAPAAVICAVNDALAPLGVRVTDVPASPARVWKAIAQARGQR